MDIPYTLSGTDAIKEKFKAGELVYLKVYLPVGGSNAVIIFDIYGIITDNPENYNNKYVGIPLNFRIVKYSTYNPIEVKAYSSTGYLELPVLPAIADGEQQTIVYKHYGVTNIKAEYSEDDGANYSLLAGVGTVQTAGTTALVGTSTKFLSTFAVGDKITVDGETIRTIATITDDTHLTSTVAFSTSASTKTYVIAEKLASGTIVWNTEELATNTDSKLKISNASTATTVSISNTFQVVAI
jgi:hypothetical protein